ncbi:hypothetical protein CI102_13205 [Trichoderma harzianum]|nr:hypothetical protein CI102_13205 [Trichoderma harzianum]
MLASSWDRPRRRTASLSPPTSWPVVVVWWWDWAANRFCFCFLRLMLTYSNTYMRASSNPSPSRCLWSQARSDYAVSYMAT